MKSAELNTSIGKSKKKLKFTKLKSNFGKFAFAKAYVILETYVGERLHCKVVMCKLL